MVADTMNMYALIDWKNAVQGELAENNNVAGPKAVTWRTGVLTIRGRFAYDDSLHGNAETYPQCARVEVWHMDNDGTDSLIASGDLAEDGSYLIGPITNADATPPPGGDARLEIYARWTFQSHQQCWSANYASLWAVTVKLGDSDSVWHYDTPVVANVPDGTHDFGMRKPTDYAHRSAAHVFDTVLDAWRYFGHTYRSQYGDPGPITVRWMPGYSKPTAYFPTLHVLQLNGEADASRFRPDEWDRFVIVHEYGHHLGAGLGQFAPLPQDSVGSSDFWGPSVSLRDAWREGWAHFVGGGIGSKSAICENFGRNTNGALTHYTFNLERGELAIYDSTNSITNLYVRNDGIGTGGHLYAMAVAAALWDVQDNVPDNPNGDAFGDSLWGGYGTILEEVLRYRPGVINTFCDFEREYLSLWCCDPDYRLESQGVFREHGMFCGSGDVPVAVEVEPALLRDLKLLPNSPNPFNPTTHFRFVLPGSDRAERVLFRIYDVRGRKIRDLLNEDRRGGVYEVVWDGTGDDGAQLGSGVYFCHLKYGGQQRTLRVTLLKWR